MTPIIEALRVMQGMTNMPASLMRSMISAVCGWSMNTWVTPSTPASAAILVASTVSAWATVRAPYFLASATPAFRVARSSDGSPGCPSTVPSSIMNLMKSEPRARSCGT